MLPSADQLFKDADFIFQQDLAPAHTAKSTIFFLNDYDVGVLDWPANSPDLNPIDNKYIYIYIYITFPGHSNLLRCTCSSHCTVQAQGGRGAGPAGYAPLAHPELVSRTHFPRDSTSLAHSSEEGHPLSGARHHMAPGRDTADLSGLPQAMEWFKSYFSIEAFQLSLESIPQVMLYYRVGFLRVPSWPQLFFLLTCCHLVLLLENIGCHSIGMLMTQIYLPLNGKFRWFG